MAVFGSIAAIAICQRYWKIDYGNEAAEARRQGFSGSGVRLISQTVRVRHPEAIGPTIDDLTELLGNDVLFGRLQRGDDLMLVAGDTRLQEGDLLAIIGEVDQLNQVVERLGEPTDQHLEFDRGEFDFRRVFVSNLRVTEFES